MINHCYVISTPVAPLGNPVAGGVNLMVKNTALAALAFSKRVTILAPQGSQPPFHDSRFELREVAGALHQPRQLAPGAGDPEGSVLSAMLAHAKANARRGDVVISIAYDAPAFLGTTEFTAAPLLHYVSMAIPGGGMAEAIAATARQFPRQVAVLSAVQGRAFGPSLPLTVLPLGIDLSLYGFNAAPKKLLGWAGRISPEKDVACALRIAKKLNMPLRIMGKVVDENYWQQCQEQNPGVELEVTGFLDTADLQQALGECAVFLMPSDWLEAYGIVVIEALACGVPVICHEDNGPGEIVREGVSGFRVKRGDDAQMAAAAQKALSLDRRACRVEAEEHYSLESFGRKLQDWLQAAIAHSPR